MIELRFVVMVLFETIILSFEIRLIAPPTGPVEFVTELILVSAFKVLPLRLRLVLLTDKVIFPPLPILELGSVPVVVKDESIFPVRVRDSPLTTIFPAEPAREFKVEIPEVLPISRVVSILY